jgi:hypothetical protein
MAGFAPPPMQASASFGNFSATENSPTPSQHNVPISRKRSRDEAAHNLEPDFVPPQLRDSQDAWEYGPGMTLIKTTKAYMPEAGSQSGTWVEEKKASEDQSRRQAELERRQQAPRSSKLQRVIGSESNDATFTPAAVSPGIALDATDIAVTHDKTPVIDTFTMHLGIGWRQLSNDEHIQAAARGWARYIENHYPLNNVHIRLESRGLQSYLVEASEGFFLFSEDLRRAQLVSTSVDGALSNLQTSPPKFDGSITLSAAKSSSTTSGEVHLSPATTDAEMVVD